MTHCITDEQLFALMDGLLPDETRAQLFAHADGCEACRELLCQAGRLGPDDEVEDEDTEVAPGPGTRVGRYLLLELVGVGAVGAVYKAHDPELDRYVALKLLRSDVASGDRAELLHSRLLREAQSMARLSDPAVIPVYDAGLFEGRVYVAMEFVDGWTLREWLHQRDRSWREVVATYAGAGRGLAAAHRAGVVHRDFKPDNVMVGAAERARVGDFGLARTTTEVDEPKPGAAGRGGADLALTRTGVMMGTPAYMAPEQARGGRVTPAVDQYAFCVALYEGLYGERPFEGDTLEALLANARAGRFRPPPARARVPGWIRRAVLRGLHPSPDERHPSMDDLLAALARDPRRKWLRASVVAGVLALIAIPTGLYQRELSRERTLCRSAEHEITEVWSAERRAAIETALLSSGLPHAPAAWSTFARVVDEWTSSWAQEHVLACEATRIHGHQSDELLDLRVQCLARQRDQLQALLELYSTSDPALVDEAAHAAFTLPTGDRCEADAVMRGRVSPPPADIHDQVEALGERLAEVGALRAGGRYQAGLEAAVGCAEEARTLGYAPLEAEAMVLRGYLELDRRALAESEASFDSGLLAATASGDDWSAARAVLGTIWSVGVIQGRREEGVELVRHAATLVERLDDDQLRAQLLYDEGILVFEEGDFAGAHERFEQALELRRAVHGPDHPKVAEMLSARSRANRMLGNLVEARDDLEQTLEIQTRTLGTDHPHLAAPLNNLGNIYWEDLADYEAARELYRRALVLAERARGPASPEVGSGLMNLGILDCDLGEYTSGLELLEQGLEVSIQALGPDHHRVAYGHWVLGRALADLGRYDDADRHTRQALTIQRHTRGPDHPEVANSLLSLALSARGRGEAEQALDLAREAFVLAERALPPGHPQLASMRRSLADVLLSAGHLDEARAQAEWALGACEQVFGPDHPEATGARVLVGEIALAGSEPAAALPPLTQALEFLDDRRGDVLLVARTRFALARALRATRGDPARAEQLAREAREALAELGLEDDPRIEEIDDWLVP